MTALMLSESRAPSRMASNPKTRTRWTRPNGLGLRPGTDYAIANGDVVGSLKKFYCV